jgi:tetratricopeptide (TPR) repeat protein
MQALSLQTTVIPSIVSTADARIWLNAERTMLVSAIVLMDGRRWATQLSSLTQVLTPWLISAGAYGIEALTVNGRLLEIARDRNDRAGEAAALHGLAWANQSLHQFPESFDYGQRALRLFREIGDAAGECAALNTMGCSTANVDTHAAEAYLRQALVAARAAGDEELEARSLYNLVFTCDSQGHYREAIGHLTECLTIAERAGNTIGICSALYSMGTFHLQLGHDELALDHLRRALALSREAGSRTIESSSLDVAGQVLRRQGRYAEALEHHQHALALTRERHDEIDEAHVLVSLGETRQAQGDIDGALDDLRQAVALADGREDRTLEARALNALGSALLANNQVVDGRPATNPLSTSVLQTSTGAKRPELSTASPPPTTTVARLPTPAASGSEHWPSTPHSKCPKPKSFALAWRPWTTTPPRTAPCGRMHVRISRVSSWPSNSPALVHAAHRSALLACWCLGPARRAEGAWPDRSRGRRPARPTDSRQWLRACRAHAAGARSVRLAAVADVRRAVAVPARLSALRGTARARFT